MKIEQIDAFSRPQSKNYGVKDFGYSLGLDESALLAVKGDLFKARTAHKNSAKQKKRAQDEFLDLFQSKSLSAAPN